MAALAVATMPTMTLTAVALTAVALAAVALTAVALVAVALAAVALAALVAGIRSLHALALQAGVGNALRVWAAGIVERRRQALTDILDIDVGDREFAPAHARPLAVIHGAQHAIIVVGMLQKVLRGNPVAGGARIARELQILLQNLIGVAADPQLLSAAFVAWRLVLAATHPVGLARAAATSASIIVVLFHMSVISSSIVIEMAGQAACRRPRAICNISKRQLPFL
jgi:hypothetical protein